jgi:predicted DNA-binding transcriptional regulator AlpA
MKLETKNSMLAEIVADPARIGTVAPEAIAGLRGELAALDTLLLVRLLSPNGSVEHSAQPDRRLNVEDAATKLGVSKDYLYRHAESLPFTVRIGRGLGFSEAGIERYLRQRSGR